jgi:hypothetical protein
MDEGDELRSPYLGEYANQDCDEAFDDFMKLPTHRIPIPILVAVTIPEECVDMMPHKILSPSITPLPVTQPVPEVPLLHSPHGIHQSLWQWNQGGHRRGARMGLPQLLLALLAVSVVCTKHGKVHL